MRSWAGQRETTAAHRPVNVLDLDLAEYRYRGPAAAAHFLEKMGEEAPIEGGEEAPTDTVRQGSALEALERKAASRAEASAV